MGFLDFIFPKYCVNCRAIGSYLCSVCFSYLSFARQFICLVCNKPAIDGMTHPGCQGRYTIDGAISSISYYGVTKKLIYTFKYKPFISDLKNILVDLLVEGIIENEQFFACCQKNPLLVPIPLYTAKLRQRGYNQAMLLAQGISDKLQLGVLDCLKRVKKTQSQFGLKREERIQNIKNSFEIKKEMIPFVKDKAVLVVDDVLTSGATLKEAAKVLKRNGAQYVLGITLARD